MFRLSSLLAAVVVLMTVTVGVAHADPSAGISVPTTGSAVAVGETVVAAGTAVNGEAGGVENVEVSFDGGATWTEAQFQGESWEYEFTPTEPGPMTVTARANTHDTIGRFFSQVTINVGGPDTVTPMACECFGFLPDLPGKPRIHEQDDQAVEVGVRTRFDRPGHVSGAIFYRGDYTGPVQMHVWSPDGTLLAEQTATFEPFVQRVMFATPPAVEPGQDYVVSYFTPSGGYPQSEHYFTGSVIRKPMIYPADAGVFRYGGGFPTDTWQQANYWIEPLFTS